MVDHIANGGWRCPPGSTSPPHNNRHHISSNTTLARKDVKDRERGARGAASTKIGNVINHMEAGVEEAESQQTRTTKINPTEVPEETQPQHSGTKAEEQGVAETTSGTKTGADNVGQQGSNIQTHGK